MTVTVYSANQTLPDFVTQGLTIGQSTFPVTGGTAVLNYSVTNIGLTQGYLAQMNYYLSSDAILSANDQLILADGFQISVPINANNSLPYTKNLSLPTMTVGNWYIIVESDGGNYVVEGIESNNTAAVPITVVAALPDFIGTNISLPAGNTMPSGSTFSADLTINNIGATSSLYSTSTFFYLSSNGNTIDPSDYLLSNGGVSSPNYINPNTSVTLTFSITTPSNLPNGTYSLITYIDRAFQHSELNENNNEYVYTSNITVSNPNQPTVQTSNLSISNVTSNSLQLNWTNGNGTGRIVCVREGQMPYATPDDGQSYTANANYSAAQTYNGFKVVYMGNGNMVNVTGLTAGTSYYFTVYEYNQSTNYDYLQFSPNTIIKHLDNLNSNSWEQVLNEYEDVSIIESIDANNLIAFSHIDGTMITSNNSGNTWQTKGKKVELNFGDKRGSEFANTITGWVWGDVTIAKTTDGGNSWSMCTMNILGQKYIHDVDFVSNLIGFGTLRGYGTDTTGLIYKTLDGGITWNAVYTCNNRLRGITFIDSLNGCAVGRNRTVLFTNNGGQTWISKNLPINANLSMQAMDVHIFDMNNVIVAVDNSPDGSVYKTTDGGNSWVNVLQATSYPLGKFEFQNSQIGYVTCSNSWGSINNYIYKTIDGGNTWSQMILPMNAFVGSMTVAGNTLWLTNKQPSPSFILRSTTAGQSNFITSTLSTSTYRPSSPISAPYTLQGTFNAGNTFTLELSDANGSFQNPITLASASSTSAGTLSGTLPSNIAQGAGYKIRITATDPVTIGAESSIFTVNSGFAAQITNIPTNLTTASSPITMAGTPSGGTFTINGTAATQFNAATLGAGTHTLVYSVSQGGCAASITQYVSVSAATLLTSSTSATSVCAGSSVNVNYNAQGNYDPTNYFTVELSDELGSFANPIVISSFGNIGTGTLACTLPQGLIQGNSYRVRVVSSLPANVGTSSNVFAVQAAPLSSVAVNVIPGNVICSGNNVTFQATPTNGGTSPVYQWKLNGTNVGVNLYQYSNPSLQDGDVIWVEMTSNAVCASTTPVVSMLTNMNVTVVETPTIESLDNIMASSSFAGNQWLLNGQPIQGATGQFYEATQTGFYQVQVTINGCTATSASFPFTYVGIETPYSAAQGVKLYPNPTEGNFTIEWEKSLSNAANMEIINHLGQVIYSQSIAAGTQIQQINLLNISKGIYLVRIGSDSIKLVVE